MGKIKAKGTPLTLKNTYTGDYITIYNSLEENIKKLGYNYKKIKECLSCLCSKYTKSNRTDHSISRHFCGL